MAQLLSYFLDPNKNEVIENNAFPNEVFSQPNPDIVSSPMAKRYNVARSYGLYGDDYDLQTFNRNAMGRAVAKRLNWNYEDLLSRPSKIANWRLPHESDITSASAQEVQLYPYFLATQKGTANTSVNRVIDPRNLSTVNRAEIIPTFPFHHHHLLLLLYRHFLLFLHVQVLLLYLIFLHDHLLHHLFLMMHLLHHLFIMQI